MVGPLRGPSPCDGGFRFDAADDLEAIRALKRAIQAFIMLKTMEHSICPSFRDAYNDCSSLT